MFVRVRPETPKISRSRPLWIMAAGLFVNITGCGQAVRDFESDSASSPQNPEISITASKQEIDQNFCQGIRPGACFSLVLRVPQPNLVADLGLSTLALANDSRVMGKRLEEACYAAWTEYKDRYREAEHYKQRSRLVNAVEKMRCIYLFDSEDIVSENLPLGDNEIALSVRLTKFAINGTKTAGQLGQVGVQMDQLTAVMDVRSAAIYNGALVNERLKGWQPVEGIGMAPYSIKSELKKEIRWRIDGQKIMEAVTSLAANPANALSSIKSFYDQALKTINALKSSPNPAEAGFVLLGVGYHAVQGMCQEKPQECKAERTTDDKTTSVSAEMNAAVPSSETAELFRLGVGRSVQGIFDHIMVSINPNQVYQKFGF